MPPKHKQHEDWQDTITRWKSKKYYCAECRDTGECQGCNGKGCMSCSYTGVCQNCLDAKHEYVEGLA